MIEGSTTSLYDVEPSDSKEWSPDFIRMKI